LVKFYKSYGIPIASKISYNKDEVERVDLIIRGGLYGFAISRDGSISGRQ
jgi:hypothetical protein